MTTLPIPNALNQAAQKLGLHVLLTHEGEAITAVLVYQAQGDKRAIVTWERGHGIVRRRGLTWVPCSLGEANAIMTYAHLARAQAAPSEDAVGQGGDACDNVLDDPRMDGVQWLSITSLPDSYIRAWPFWEERDTDQSVYTLGNAVILQCRPALVRPLRLPGMNERGEIPASAMTPEHFERVRDWQMACWESDFTDIDGQPDMDYVTADDEYEFWRPAIFAKLNEK